MPRWRRPVLWLSAVLFILNAAIAWRLFHVEYLSQTGTGVGVIIAYARYARDHWPDLNWCRFWYAGLPFRNAYVPGLPLAAAVLSGIAHISAGRAFYKVVASIYCLGPVTLFWMAFRLTRSTAWSFYAGLAYSLLSPSAFLAPEIRRDLGSLFWDQRLHTMAGYADNQNVAALTLLPLAILALDAALEKRRPIYFVAAAAALAAVPLTNWPGAIALTFAVLAYGLVQPRAGGLRRWVRIAAMGAVGYALAVTWIPPSTVFATQADTQGFVAANKFTAHHLMHVSTLERGRARAAIPALLPFVLLLHGRCHTGLLLVRSYARGAAVAVSSGDGNGFHPEPGVRTPGAGRAPAHAGKAVGGSVRHPVRRAVLSIQKLRARPHPVDGHHTHERVQNRALVRPAHAGQPCHGTGFDHLLDECLHRYTAAHRMLSPGCA